MNVYNLDNYEDNHSSANTSLSGLTGYEEQLNNLKYLNNSDVQPSRTEATTNHNHECCSTLMYETRIKNLNIELQNSLKLNEKYKNDLFNFERKLHLENHERINTLVARNAQLEGHLEFANKQIEILLKRCNQLGNESNIQNGNVSLQSQIDFLQNELIRSNNARYKMELQIKELICELQETKDEKQSRTGCIEELKKKICEQHTSIQNILQEKAKCEVNLASIKNDFAWCLKSENWYKEQLHACQAKKSKISEENLNLQHILAEENRKNDAFKVEVSKWKNRYDELFLSTEKTKEMLQRRIEQLEYKLPNKTEATETNSNELERVREYYENVVQDLGEEMIKIKQEVVRQNEIFQKVTTDNSSLVARITTLQKSLNDKEIANENLQIRNKDLNNKLFISLQNLEDTKKEMLDLQMKKQEIEVKLVASEHEKKEIENTVILIRNDFNKVIQMHKKLKNELHEKEKNNLLLQSEKQSLFMSNNWRICEMEELKNNASKIEVLENLVKNCELKELELVQRNQLLVEQNEKLKDTVSFFQKDIVEKENKLKSLESEKNKVFTELAKTKEKLNDLHKKVEYLKKDLDNRDVEILQLQKEVKELTSHCHIISTTKETLQKDLSEMETAQTNIHRQLEDIKKSLCDKDIKILKLEEDKEQLKNENITLGKKNDEFQINNSILKQQLSKLTANNNNYSTTNAEISHNNFQEIFIWILQKISQIEDSEYLNKNDFICTIQSFHGPQVTILQGITDKLYKIQSSKQKSIFYLEKFKLAMKKSKRQAKEFRNQLLCELKNMTERCNRICRVNEETSQMLDKVLQKRLLELQSEEKNDIQMEIMQLKAVVKAREREMAEKIKRYVQS